MLLDLIHTEDGAPFEALVNHVYPQIVENQFDKMTRQKDELEARKYADQVRAPKSAPRSVDDLDVEIPPRAPRLTKTGKPIGRPRKVQPTTETVEV